MSLSLATYDLTGCLSKLQTTAQSGATNDVGSLFLEVDVHARVAELANGDQGTGGVGRLECGGDVVQQLAAGLQIPVDLAIVGNFGAINHEVVLTCPALLGRADGPP